MKENPFLQKDLIEPQKRICKYVISISENVYIHKLNDQINECNNRYHSTTKMKPDELKSSAYINLV